MAPANAVRAWSRRPAWVFVAIFLIWFRDRPVLGQFWPVPGGLAAEQLLAAYPDLVRTLRANRAFLARAVR
jgi:hypothetical protein